MPEPAAGVTHPFRATYPRGPAFRPGEMQRLPRPDRRHVDEIDVAAAIQGLYYTGACSHHYLFAIIRPAMRVPRLHFAASSALWHGPTRSRVVATLLGLAVTSWSPTRRRTAHWRGHATGYLTLTNGTGRARGQRAGPWSSISTATQFAMSVSGPGRTINSLGWWI
jgi:hypothetical protein